MISASDLKQAIPPPDFYRAELPALPPSGRQPGWTDGGLCPFHDDRRPGSFKVNLKTGAFRCFSCGTAGGDIIAFAMTRTGATFRETLEYLAASWGVASWR